MKTGEIKVIEGVKVKKEAAELRDVANKHDDQL